MRCRLARYALQTALAILALAPSLHGQPAAGAGRPTAGGLQGLSAFVVKFSGRIPAEMDTIQMRTAMERELRRSSIRVVSPMALATDTTPASRRGVIVVSVNVIPVRNAVETQGAAIASELMLSRTVFIPETSTLTAAAVWSTNALAVASTPRVPGSLEASLVDLVRKLANDIRAARGR
jgi:hypothetical protein